MKKWYKKCPSCTKEIKESAKKCQYCHKNLNNKETIWKTYNASFLEGYFAEEQLKVMMEEKDKETPFRVVLKWFDYVWWIIILWCIIIVFKWYSITPLWRRIIMWCYLIGRVYTVWKSLWKNVIVARNVNVLFRVILKVKDMIMHDADKDEIFKELNISRIFESFHKY